MEQSIVDIEHTNLFPPLTPFDATQGPTYTELVPSFMSDDIIQHLNARYENEPGTFIFFSGEAGSKIYDIDESKKSFYLVLDLLLTIPETKLFKTRYEIISNTSASNIETVVGIPTYMTFVMLCKNILYEVGNKGTTEEIINIATKSKLGNIICRKVGPLSYAIMSNGALVDKSPGDYNAVKMKHLFRMTLSDTDLFKRVTVKMNSISASYTEAGSGFSELFKEDWNDVSLAEKLPCIKTRIIDIQCLFKKLFVK